MKQISKKSHVCTHAHILTKITLVILLDIWELYKIMSLNAMNSLSCRIMPIYRSKWVDKRLHPCRIASLMSLCVPLKPVTKQSTPLNITIEKSFKTANGKHFQLSEIPHQYATPRTTLSK
jgi:hypothetical protein